MADALTDTMLVAIGLHLLGVTVFKVMTYGRRREKVHAAARPMRPTGLLLAIAGILLTGVWMMQAPVAVTAQTAPSGICHTPGNGRVLALTVDDRALPAHLAHGDAERPNGLAPGSGGFVYDSACAVVSWLYGINVAPDPSAIDPATAGNLFAGSGIPAINFGVAQDLNAGIELGLMVLYRQGPTLASSDDYTDGVLHFTVNDGPQSTSNGSSANVPNRASWNFTFSIATGLNGASTSLDDHTFQLLYDVDPGPGATYRTLTLEAEPGVPAGGQSGFQWRDQGTGLVFISDDEGNANVTQNSQNYAFGFVQNFLTSAYGPGNSFAGPARFDIVLQALDAGQIIVRNHVAVDVVP